MAVATRSQTILNSQLRSRIEASHAVDFLRAVGTMDISRGRLQAYHIQRRYRLKCDLQAHVGTGVFCGAKVVETYHLDRSSYPRQVKRMKRETLISDQWSP
jgi:hypothetical protein